MQKKVISNTTFEGNLMMTIEGWQGILANKIVTNRCWYPPFRVLQKFVIYSLKSIADSLQD
jgi:hypothetical protein